MNADIPGGLAGIWCPYRGWTEEYQEWLNGDQGPTGCMPWENFDHYLGRERDELVAQYLYETQLCSSGPHMLRQPSAARIWGQGFKMVPALLRALEDKDAGMNVMYMLHRITGEWPEYEEVTTDLDGETGFVGFDVDRARQAWIRWGRLR